MWDSVTISQQMERWYGRPLGRALYSAERNGLQDFVDKLFGYHLLQLAGPKYPDFLEANTIRHKIYLNVDQVADYNGSKVQSKMTELPFLPATIDAVIMPHVLEFVDRPHQVLSEISHILIPEGQLVIIGFNPFSWWGLARLWRKHQHAAPWCGHFISARRLQRWLTRLGFTLLDYKTFFFRPPLSSKKALDKMLFMEGVGQMLWQFAGGVYILSAKKSILGVTPLKESANKLQITVATPCAEPTTRVIDEGN